MTSACPLPGLACGWPHNISVRYSLRRCGSFSVAVLGVIYGSDDIVYEVMIDFLPVENQPSKALTISSPSEFVDLRPFRRSQRLRYHQPFAIFRLQYKFGDRPRYASVETVDATVT